MRNVSDVKVTLSADAVTDTLRELILGGSLGIGVQLRQEDLAKRFGVSRIPIREALKQLQAEGLVEHYPNRGSVVATRSVEDLLETLDIRLALEKRALELAIPNMTSKDFRAAREVIAQYDRSLSPRKWTELNLQFHLTLYRPCRRMRLVKMIEDLVRSVSMHLRTHISHTVGRGDPQAEHKQILKACVDGDADRAVRLLERHIEHTQSALVAANGQKVHESSAV